MEICEALDLEFYIGPPRPHQIPPQILEIVGLSEETSLSEAVQEIKKRIETGEAAGKLLQEAVREIYAIAQEEKAELAVLLSSSGEVSEDSEKADERNLARRYPDVRLAAGSGAINDREDLVESLSLPSEWLQAHGLNIRHVCLVNVWGDSMVPTLHDGDGVFVNLARNRPRSGRIYALRTADGTVVKRLRKRQGRWWADSDNPEVGPHLIEEGDEVVGEIAGRADPEKHDVG